MEVEKPVFEVVTQVQHIDRPYVAIEEREKTGNYPYEVKKVEA